MSSPNTEWLAMARELQAIAQNGLAFTKEHFDTLRYRDLSALAAKMLAGLTHSTPEEIGDLLDGEAGYTTPKVEVRGVVARGDQMLFVRERSDGLWTLPGGWADQGLSPAQCIEKEIREESGFIVTADKLLAALDRDRHAHPPYIFAVYKLFFRCTLIRGEATPSDETSEVAFFSRDNIPPLSQGRITVTQVERMFAHLRHPDWPADFD